MEPDQHPLERVIDFLTTRFPERTPTAVAETVYATHARLRDAATVPDHLTALTQRQAADALAAMPPPTPQS